MSLTHLIPEPPPIDTTKAGVLELAPELIGDLLRLPAGQRISAAKMDGDTIELLVEGAGLPERPATGPFARVALVCHVETRPGDSAAGGYEVRRTMAWSHDPSRRWTLQTWEPAAQ